MYAASTTGSMQRAIEETDRRREKQVEHNKEHGITPKTISKKVLDVMEAGAAPSPKGRKSKKEAQDQLEQMEYAKLKPSDAAKKIKSMEKQMFDHARDLEFEQAAALRDKIDSLRSISLGPGVADLAAEIEKT